MKLVLFRDEDGELFAGFETEKDFPNNQKRRADSWRQVTEDILNFRMKLREVLPRNGFMVINVE